MDWLPEDPNCNRSKYKECEGLDHFSGCCSSFPSARISLTTSAAKFVRKPQNLHPRP